MTAYRDRLNAGHYKRGNPRKPKVEIHGDQPALDTALPSPEQTTKTKPVFKQQRP